MTAVSPEILLVQDDARHAEVTLRALRVANLDHGVHCVSDGEAALEYLFATGRYAGRQPVDPPQLMLLDVKLSKMDGIEVLRRVKGSDLGALPVVMMTSSTEERAVLKSFGLGVSGYLVKPVQFDALIETVARIGLYAVLSHRIAHPAA